MKSETRPSRSGSTARSAFTLVEVTVTMGLATLIFAVIAYLIVYGARTYVSMGNYVDLDTQSRNAVDVLGREVRNVTAVTTFQTNSLTKSLTLTNSILGGSSKIFYSSTTRTLVLQKTGQPDRTLLSQCDQWSFAMYDRAPIISSTNILFHYATNGAAQLNPAACKLINMTWKCSRTLIGAKLTTESVQTAEIVLRNKLN